MAKYKVYYKLTQFRVMEVEAESKEDAKEKWNSEEYSSDYEEDTSDYNILEIEEIR